MFQRLDIKDFQSHADTRIDVDPRLTVLVGQSNVGKTAVFRALCWIIRNRPLGSAFIRHGADIAEVTLLVDNMTVGRRKGRKGLNEYIVAGEVLEALGSDVPEQATARLNMGDINLADQLDRHFLLLDPPGQVARQLNEAVHLDKAEAVARAAEAEARDAKARIKDLDARLQTAKAAADALAWVSGAREGLEAVRDIAGQHARCSDRRYGLRRLLGDLAAVDRGMVGICIPRGAAAQVERLAGESAKLAEARVRQRRLTDLLAGINVADGRLTCLGDVRGLAGAADVVAADADIWETGARQLNRLMDLLDGLTDYTKRQGELEKGIQIRGQEARELLAALIECPACGQPLTVEARRRLLL